MDEWIILVSFIIKWRFDLKLIEWNCSEDKKKLKVVNFST